MPQYTLMINVSEASEAFSGVVNLSKGKVLGGYGDCSPKNAAFVQMRFHQWITFQIPGGSARLIAVVDVADAVEGVIEIRTTLSVPVIILLDNGRRGEYTLPPRQPRGEFRFTIP